MAEYARELDGNWLHVWVNPPRELLSDYEALVTTLQEQELESARQVLALNGNQEKATPMQKTFDQVARWLKIKKEKAPEGLDRKLLEWYAHIWSQGPPDTHWTIDELRTLESQDPAFLSWMVTQTWKARTAHIQQKKKA